MPRIPGAATTLNQPDGVETGVTRVGKQLGQVVQQLHGRHWELASRAQMFFACSQAATTTTIALATTYTGICLSNPAASGVNLELLGVGVALSVAPAAIATISLGGGYAAAGVVTHTTPLTVFNNKLDSALTGSGLADAAATLVGTPRDIMPLIGGFTAAALYSGSGGYFDIGGAICIPPGGYAFVETLTVVVGWFGMWWAEWPE